MLWREMRPGHRKLLRGGTQGQGVVRHVKRLSQNTGKGSYASLVTLHMRFDDGTDVTVDRVVEVGVLRLPRPGDIVPVRFDPKDHRRLEVDVPAIRDRREHATQVAEAAAVAEAEEAVSPTPSRPDS